MGQDIQRKNKYTLDSGYKQYKKQNNNNNLYPYIEFAYMEARPNAHDRNYISVCIRAHICIII